MAPKGKSAAAAAAPAPVEEIIEEIVPEQPERPATVTFVLDEEGGREYDYGDEEGDFDNEEDIEGGDNEDGDDDVDDDDNEDDIEEEDDALTTAVGQLTQLMMTEDGEAITDVLSGIRDSIEKQNKILYRGLQLLEARFVARK